MRYVVDPVAKTCTIESLRYPPFTKTVAELKALTTDPRIDYKLRKMFWDMLDYYESHVPS
jgi:hypothetical protein